MRRPRDSQRTKVYRAESTLPEMWAIEHTPGDEQTAYVAATLAHPKVVARFGRQTVRLLWKRNGSKLSRAYRLPGRHRIELAPAHRSRMILLHELAHILAPSEARHNREFVEVYIFLVRVMMGVAMSKRLRDAFKAGGVKYKRQREISEVQRAAMRARLFANIHNKVAA